MMARNLMRAAVGGVPITSPNHPNLVLLYDMGDTVSGSTQIDASQNGYNATIVGATIVSGKLGNALNFPSGTALNAISNDAGNFGTGSFSIVCWINNALSVSNKTIIDNRLDAAPGQGYALYMNSAGQLAGLINDGVSSETLSSVQTVNDNSPHLIVLNVDRSGDLSFYIDSVFDNSLDLTPLAGSLSNPTPFVIGNKGVSVSSLTNFGGWLDQFRLFDRVLTQAEIDELYNGGVGA